MVKEVDHLSNSDGTVSETPKWLPVTYGDVVREFTRAHADTENPFPEELEPRPVGSILVEKQSVGVEALGTATSLTLLKGERATVRLAHIDGMTLKCDLPEPNGIVEIEGDTVLHAVNTGTVDTTLRATIPADPKDPTSRAQVFTATFKVQVIDAGTRSIDKWFRAGSPLQEVALAAGQSYFIAPPSGKLSDFTFSSIPTLSISPSGLLQGLAGSYLISATQDKDVYYASVRFVDTHEPLALPPSVFRGANGPLQLKARLRYRPIAQELVLLSQDQREATSRPNVVRGIAEFGLRILGWSVLHHQTSHSPDLSRGDLVPGLIALGPEALNAFLPDRSQVHRNALLTQGMREFESIPRGGQLHKVVFFPKAILNGYLRDNKVRIASVDAGSFRISVGVVTGTATLSQQKPPP